METPETSLDLIHLDPEKRGVAVAVPPGILLVALHDSEAQIHVKGKPAKTLHEGEMTWIDAGAPGVTSNPSSRVSSYLQLSLKTAAETESLRPVSLVESALVGLSGGNLFTLRGV